MAREKSVAVRADQHRITACLISDGWALASSFLAHEGGDR